MRYHRSLRYLVFVSLLVAVLGCDSANPVAPAGTSLLVTANPARIQIDGFSTIVVSGTRPDGNPLFPGTQINLSTTLGDLTDTVLSVGDDGTAQTILRSDGRTGDAMITAATQTGDASAETSVLIGENDTTTPVIEMTAQPAQVGFFESSTIIAVIRNADNSLVGPGNLVTFDTTRGTLTPANGRVRTDGQGTAEITLTADDRPGTATVTARFGSAAANTVDVEVEGRAPVLFISANPTVIDTTEQSAIEILARDDNNVPVGANREIQLFSDLGTVEPASVVRTDSAGRATATFTAGSIGGTGSVTAILENSDPATVTITIRQDAASIIINVQGQFTRPTAGSPIEFPVGAQVLDAENDPIANIVVSFGVFQTNAAGTGCNTSAGVGGAEFQVPGGSTVTTTAITNSNGTATLDLEIEDTDVTGLNSICVQVSAGAGIVAQAPINIL
ncbi:MAG: Ig-like domain-containing protein [Acidobacteriota bacterium]